jgi:hypothetical protein
MKRQIPGLLVNEMLIFSLHKLLQGKFLEGEKDYGKARKEIF